MKSNNSSGIGLNQSGDFVFFVVVVIFFGHFILNLPTFSKILKTYLWRKPQPPLRSTALRAVNSSCVRVCAVDNWAESQ